MAKIEQNELCPCKSGLLFKECHGPKVKKPKTPDIIQTITLEVIPEPAPDSRTLFINTGEGSVTFRGYEVGLALTCGSCHAHLVVGIPRNNIRDIVIKCNVCGSFNEL